MEEESFLSFLPDILRQPQQDSQPSADQQFIPGEQMVVWDETQVQINQTKETNEVSLSSKTGCKTTEEAEQYEELIWIPQPITCNSPLFSVAMVKWDMPDSSTETPLLMTDCSLANELDLGSLNNICPSVHQPQGLFKQEEQDDAKHLNSAMQCPGNDSEPCDAADVKEPKSQEKEDSAHELLESNGEIPLRTAIEEDEEHSLTSAAVETKELIDTVEDAVDTCINLKLEEEQEVIVLLTEQEDPEAERSSANCVVQEQQSLTTVFCGEEQTLLNDVEGEEEDQDGSEAREHQRVTNVYSKEESVEAETVSSLGDLDLPAEPLQTDNFGLNISTDHLIDLQEPELLETSEHSGPEEERLNEDVTAQPEELEMCEDVDQNVGPKHSEAADNIEEPSTQEAENTEKLENLVESIEVTVSLEQANCLEHQKCDQTVSQNTLQPEYSEQQDMAEKQEEMPAEDLSQLGLMQDLDQSPETELRDQSTQSENIEQPEDPAQSEQPVCLKAEITEQTAQSEQLIQSEQTDESETTEQPSPETEISQNTEEADLNPDQAEDTEDVERVVANGAQHKASGEAHMNGGEVDRMKARRLAERLFNLDNIEQVDVVKHIDKDNDFSRAVGEEYLKFFDFADQTLDQALRSFLKVVLLIGETQERERVLQHFSNRFHECNPNTYSSPGAVLALTCALMLLNTDLHGQHVGKSMSSSKFVSNLDGMNEGENFNMDLLKSLYNSIKSEPLEWAVDEEELKNLVDESASDNAPLRSKANPFQDVPHDKKASVFKEGFLQRKLHADINGKRTPWGKRGWKRFYGTLKGMVLYLQKSDDRRDQTTNEEVVSVHHSMAEQAAGYTKKPYVFRLQTADWRIFLFQTSSNMEMNLWISRINLVSALNSSPPFPAAVGSQRRFFRPILPASQSSHPLERQLQFHKGKLESFKTDLSHEEENPPDPKKAKAKDLEEHRLRTEYLHHEVCRYEIYIQMLEIWESVKKTNNSMVSSADLILFDKAVSSEKIIEGEGGLKRSYSSPSLELEIAVPVIKVKRNVSERRTYRKTIIPRWTKEA